MRRQLHRLLYLPDRKADAVWLFLRWAALPVTDRRWAAPLAAIALGFGLFVGVAIGPGTAGTFATGAAQVIEIPGLVGGADDGAGAGEAEAAAPSAAHNTGRVGGGGGAATTATSMLPPVAPSEPEGGESSQPPSRPEQDSAPPAGETAPERETLAGVVVHVNPAAVSYTLADTGGTLDVIHAAKAPRPGTRVTVPVRTLANGTFAEAGTRTRSGERMRATVNGIVTYVDSTPAAPAYTVSARGASILVHVHPDPAGVAPAMPALGAFAKVAVEIEKRMAPPAASGEAGEDAPATEGAPASCGPDPSQPSPPPVEAGAVLWQQEVSAAGAPFAYSDFEGIVEALCPDSGQLLLSADDVDESAHDLLFSVPPTIDVAPLKPGQSIVATATIGADGSLTLTGLASDERTKGAEDESAAQGDLAPR